MMHGIRSTIVDTNTCTALSGKWFVFEYHLLQSKLEDENGTFIDSYGIEISSKPDGEKCAILDITSEHNTIDGLIHLMIHNDVTPVSLPYVVEDWLSGYVPLKICV